MKIGLIAMSGVRACDEELLRLGLTLPGFVERSRVIASLPSLGLLTLAGCTPAGHEVAYREVGDLPPADAPLEPFDLVAISTFTAQAHDAYALADRYRAAGVPVVMGGLHATSLPEEALGHCNAVAVGEGEPVWAKLVADAEAGQLQRVYRGDGRFRLEDAPMPRFDLLDIGKYNRLTVQTSRGCPWRCEFCASSILLTPRYKQKPIGKVLAEIDRIRELWRRPFIEFADDNSFADRRYWRALLPELAKRRIKWFTETDVSVGEDAELLDLMRRAGCAEVLIGLESPSAGGLDGLEMKADWKRVRQPRYRRCVRAIQERGIRVNGCFILGLDGQGPDVFDEVFDFAAELALYDVQVTVLTPFPGTPLYARLQREGRLIDASPAAWRKCTLFDVNFHPRGMTAQELRAGLHDLAGRLYNESFTAYRREAFGRLQRAADRRRRTNRANMVA